MRRPRGDGSHLRPRHGCRQRAPGSKRTLRHHSSPDHVDAELLDVDNVNDISDQRDVVTDISCQRDVVTDDHDYLATHHDDDPSCGDLGRYVAMSASATVQPGITSRSVRALGTTATVVVLDVAHAHAAKHMLCNEIEALDRACSRFRPDSELAALHANAGSTVKVSSLLFEALDVAYSMAEKTDGAVDPTVGNAIEILGYDRDFDQIENRSIPKPDLGTVCGFRHLHLDRLSRTARVPKGVRLDLGSSAKALLADRAAAHIAEKLDSGVLVSIGGDIAVAGEAPLEGWCIGIAMDSSTGADDVDQVVTISAGGLASSSTQVRTWQMDGEHMHHIVDPATGRSAAPYWHLVSAAGASCVDANALSTAAVVWGDSALDRLRPYNQPVRLLRHDGEVFVLGNWPQAEPS